MYVLAVATIKTDLDVFSYNEFFILVLTRFLMFFTSLATRYFHFKLNCLAILISYHHREIVLESVSGILNVTQLRHRYLLSVNLITCLALLNFRFTSLQIFSRKYITSMDLSIAFCIIISILFTIIY